MNVHKTIRDKIKRNAERQSSEINNCRVLKRLILRVALVETRLLKCRALKHKRNKVALKHTARVFSFAQWAFYSRHPPKSASFKPPLHAARPLIVTWF